MKRTTENDQQDDDYTEYEDDHQLWLLMCACEDYIDALDIVEDDYLPSDLAHDMGYAPEEYNHDS